MNELPILKCDSLHKVFQDGEHTVNVLQGIDFQIHQGEQVAIVGPSGAGKSTFLHCLSGLDEITEGQIIIDGNEIAKLNEKKRSRLRNLKLGFVYQFHHLLAEFDVTENVSMPLLIRGDTPKEAMTKAKVMLEKVGLEDRLDFKISQLSGGERQRTAIARALVTSPLCVIADEPTGNLDKKTAQLVYQTMLELNQKSNTSLLIATHDLKLASQMDRVLVLERGLLSEISPQELV